MPMNRSQSGCGALTSSVFERDHRLGPSLERGVAGDLEVTDPLDDAVTELGFTVGVTCQDGAGSGPA